MAITQICDETINNLQNNQITCLIFLDLSKAFDCVDHQILFTKLYNYGVRGLPLKLFQNYLTNRTQQTIINNYKSTPLPITCGVPQGSILGPLLFNIYINNIIDSSNFKIRLFADDACLSYSSNNPVNLNKIVNNELENINNWRIKNKLTVNFSKSNFMVFSRKKLNFEYKITMEGKQLNKVKETKYLGVILDEKFSWKGHINHLVNKISRASYILSKIRYYVDLPILKMLYFSLVHPHLIYCLTAWGGTSPSILKPIVTLQKKIIRIITFSSFNSPSATIFIKLNILPFDQQYKQNLSILMHKIYNNNITGTYNLTLTNKIHNLNTRSSKNQNFYQNFSKLNIGLNSFVPKGIKCWNKIPINIKNKPLHIFKKQLKQHLINSFKEQIT